MKSIRSTQYVTAFGPGAIFDFGGESLIAMDQDAWNPVRAAKISLPRLQVQATAICGRPINHFLVPPIEDDQDDKAVVSDTGVPYYRFPRWLFCPDCRHMARWEQRDEEDLLRRLNQPNGANSKPTCNRCHAGADLVPMRFVYVCKAGHIGDINWPDWVHSHPQGNDNQPGCRSVKDLSLNARTGAGGGLASLVIQCNACKAKRSLGELMKPTEISRSGTSCRGTQPWSRQGGQCNEMPRAEQRGSSNVYFPRLLSALDIPDLGNNPLPRGFDWDALNDYKRRYQNSPPVLKRARLTDQWRQGVTSAGKKVGLTYDEACEYIEAVPPAPAEAPPPNIAVSLADADELLKQDEWEAFLEDRTYDQFKCLRHEIEAGLLTGISFVTEVKTLREVRAFTGFSRLSPSNAVVPSSNRCQWLPGIEVFGEGIFLALDDSLLLAWEHENGKSLKARLDRMLRARNEDKGLVGTLPEPTPRFVLLHTLSHALIRQLSFECGYETASLRERLYCTAGVNGQPGRCGVLIYTASSDSEGALGGLARQGVPDRFVPGFKMAIKRSSWCSSDPVCAESQSQGLGGLNRAACHACMLITETSCTCFNTMLDRSLLIGDGSAMHGGVKGFFRNLETDNA